MKYNRSVDSFISFFLQSHEVKTTREYPNSIFWLYEGKVIAEIQNSEYFGMHYKIWDEISDQFGLEFDDTQLVIKTWLEQHYGLGQLEPIFRIFTIEFRWDSIMVWDEQI